MLFGELVANRCRLSNLYFVSMYKECETMKDYRTTIQDLKDALDANNIKYGYTSTTDIFFVKDAVGRLYELQWDDSSYDSETHKPLYCITPVVINELNDKVTDWMLLDEIITFLKESKHNQMEKLISYLNEGKVPYVIDGEYVRITFDTGYIRASENPDGTFYVRDTGWICNLSLVELQTLVWNYVNEDSQENQA